MVSKRFAVLGLFLASACHPLWVSMEEPPGTPEYKLGWEDGCDTALSAEGGWDYKLMWGFKKRPEMAANDQYKQGWNEGFGNCRFSYGSSKNAGKWSDVGLGGGSIHKGGGGKEEGD